MITTGHSQLHAICVILNHQRKQILQTVTYHHLILDVVNCLYVFDFLAYF